MQTSVIYYNRQRYYKILCKVRDYINDLVAVDIYFTCINSFYKHTRALSSADEGKIFDL